MQSDLDKDLLTYFTDVEHLRDGFKKSVAAQTLSKRILVIHGVGGVGKSSLLRMFRIHCKSEKIPVALASGDDTKSVLDSLTRWMEDLTVDGVKFASLGKALENYRAIQAKVDEQAKMQNARSRMGDIAGKAASKTAETAGGALMGAAIGSVIPGVGTAIGGALGGVLGGTGAEALVDWLCGFLTKPDIDLLLDPAKKLTSDFLEDIAKAAEKRRIVLMLDTFEQMSALEDWARDVAQRIHPNVLLVIAGRKLPDWNRTWQDWMVTTQVEELKPMTEEVMRNLIQRYYATMRGGEPNPVQVEAIIHFARGLPMVVTGAVQLWVKYGVEDFQSVKAEIVANLVDRLIEGVPDVLIPALEAAAAVRWFDQPILRAVTGLVDVREVYNELRRFPFVRTRTEGLALHDAVREIIDENLRVQDSERHCELHERAAAYFEKRLEKITGEEAERLGLERLYHRVLADEEAGIRLFQEMAEELTRYRLVNRLRALLNDANTYPLEHENSRLWRQYYSARLMYLESRFVKAGEVFESISSSNSAEPKLHAYILSDLGQILEILGAHDRSIPVLESSLSNIQIDSHLAASLLELCHAFRRTGELEKSEAYLLKAKEFFAASNDRYGLIFTLNVMKYHYFNQGLTRKATLCLKQSKEVLATITPTPRYLLQETLGGNGVYWIWLLGRYKETEQDLVTTLNINQELGIVDMSGTARDLGYVLGMQGKYEEAEKYFSQSTAIAEDIDIIVREANFSIGKGFRGDVLKRQGLLGESEAELKTSLSYKQRVNDSNGIPELYLWLGELSELRAKQNLNQNRSLEYSTAQSYYYQTQSLHWTGRRYFICAALVGLVRVKHAQGDYAAIPPLLAEAEQLAQQYEYNDHLASLRLTQGHLAWEDANKSDTLLYYQKAMIYALRYNRFLLDELLNGRPQGTPLHPIIPYCLERGEDGKKTLIALRDWWKTGSNDIGTPRPDTISPIPEGISLLETEKIAREREPGDGSVQETVVEKIETVL